jgi:hypothetical protein
MHSNIDCNTQECFTVIRAKNLTEELIQLSNKLERQSYVTKLLKQLYSELEYQHELLKNPSLNKALKSNDSWLD